MTSSNLSYMKKIILLLVIILFVSCSSDDSNGDSSQHYVKFQDLFDTYWFYDDIVYTLEDDSVIVVERETCESESWFHIGTGALSGVYSFMDDGNGGCEPFGGTSFVFAFYDQDNGFFEVHFNDFINDTQSDHFMEFFLTNNGTIINDGFADGMLWDETDPDEIYLGQNVIRKQFFFRRR